MRLLESEVIFFDFLNYIFKCASAHHIIQNVTTLLTLVCKERKNHELALGLVSLMNGLTREEGTCRHLLSLSVISPLILASEKLYAPLSEPSENAWPLIYRQLSLLQVKLLHTLGPRYLSDALDWIGVHQDRILYSITNALKEPLSIDQLSETEMALGLLIEISNYKDAWIREVGQVRSAVSHSSPQFFSLGRQLCGCVHPRGGKAFEPDSKNV